MRNATIPSNAVLSAPASHLPVAAADRRRLGDVLARVARAAPVRLVVGIALCLATPPLLARTVRPLIGASLAGAMPLARTALLLLTYALVVRFSEQRRVAELPLRRAPHHLAGGALAGVLTFAAVFALLLALGTYPVVELQRPLGLPATAALLLYLAFAEEVVFRGFFQRILEERLGTWLALLASNTLFALAHHNNQGATAISTAGVALAGLGLGLLFALTRSLWWPGAAHFAWNATQVLSGAAVSGHTVFAHAALLRLFPRSDAWLTGGEFGPEGSIVTLVVLLALASGLAGAAAAQGALRPPRWRRRRPPKPVSVTPS
ncbi:MAG: CPBP family intramembrane metalloprotease [Thermoanaerobaculaceae bacterium]|nr:CPBP family intramembrane metalloprotease [Thermoanaerobaculaceae bacterium]